MRIQRNIIYRKRNELIEEGDISIEYLLDVCKKQIADFLEENPSPDENTLLRHIFDNYSYRYYGFGNDFDITNKKHIEDELLSIFKQNLVDKQLILEKEQQFAMFKRTSILKAIDSCWVEQVDYLQELRHIVANTQKPLYNYNKEAIMFYDKMKKEVRRNIVKNISLSDISRDRDNKLAMYFP